MGVLVFLEAQDDAYALLRKPGKKPQAARQIFMGGNSWLAGL